MNNFFLPQSGNLGDTCNILPVLSGIYKATGEKIDLKVRDKMKNFKGFKKLMESQECINSLKFESSMFAGDYINLYLMNEFTKSLNRPWETVRYEEYVRNHLNIDFKVDDDFILHVPHKDITHDAYIVGDRSYSKDADTRRSFDVIKNSGKFKEDKCYYLDYSDDLITNLNIIKNNKYQFITTFTGIAILADLMMKESLIFYPQELSFWDNKPIVYSFNQHFYRDRNCELVAIDEF